MAKDGKGRGGKAKAAAPLSASGRAFKPKHSLDAKRSNGKVKDGQRTAATVSRRRRRMGPRVARLPEGFGGACMHGHDASIGANLPPPDAPLVPRPPPVQVRRLKMYKKRPKRDATGTVLHEDFQSQELPSTRIQPDRRWFGNTRVVGQKQLEQFRQEMSTKVNDAYTVLLREKKLPLQLLEDPEKKIGGKQVRASLVATQPFADTFGKSKKRKKPKLLVDSLEELVQAADAKEEK
jgi:hypothetical protein